MTFMQQRNFQQMLHDDTRIFASIILHMIIIFIEQLLLVVILKFYTVPMLFARRQKLAKPENIFK